MRLRLCCIYAELDRVSDALEGCTNVEQIDLSHNKLKDANGFSSLAQLQKLDLTANRVTDFIAISLPATIECIRLAGNNIKAPSDLKGASCQTRWSGLTLFLASLQAWHL